MKLTLIGLSLLSVAALPVLVMNYQESPPQVLGHLAASVGTVPVANGTWSVVKFEKGGTYAGVHSYPLTGVDCSGATGRYAMLTDISIYHSSTNNRSVWWIRDQNSNKVLWVSWLDDVSPTSIFSDRVHFNTPIVFTIGPLPPVVEVGGDVVPGFTPWPSGTNNYTISALGRYVFSN